MCFSQTIIVIIKIAIVNNKKTKNRRPIKDETDKESANECSYQTQIRNSITKETEQYTMNY